MLVIEYFILINAEKNKVKVYDTSVFYSLWYNLLYRLSRDLRIDKHEINCQYGLVVILLGLYQLL